MDDPLHIIAEQEGVFLYREAMDAGYKDKQIQAKRRTGEWHRVRHGAYCFGDVWATLSAEERHLVLAHAVRRTTPGMIVFSHVTALVAHGIAVWGADLSVVHATRLDSGSARKQSDVRHHVGVCLDEDIMKVRGLLVTGPARAVLEAGTILDTEPALVSFDNSLWQAACSPDELWKLFKDRCTHWPGSRNLHIVLRLMDGAAQTPGETRSRYLFWRHGLPAPMLQWKIYDGDQLVAVTDFAWPEHRLFGEFDGLRKYLRDLRKGERPEDVVVREKKREDLVRRLTLWGCIRIIWADFYHPARTAAYVRSMMSIAA